MKVLVHVEYVGRKDVACDYGERIADEFNKHGEKCAYRLFAEFSHALYFIYDNITEEMYSASIKEITVFLRDLYNTGKIQYYYVSQL